MDSLERLGAESGGALTPRYRRILLDGSPGGGIQDASRWEEARMLQVGEPAPDQVLAVLRASSSAMKGFL